MSYLGHRHLDILSSTLSWSSCVELEILVFFAVQHEGLVPVVTPKGRLMFYVFFVSSSSICISSKVRVGERRINRHFYHMISKTDLVLSPNNFNTKIITSYVWRIQTFDKNIFLLFLSSYWNFLSFVGYLNNT